MAQEYTLAELMICAASEAWRNDGEVLATGIGTLPRLAASLSMLTTNPDLMMTDSEAFLLSAPNPISAIDPAATPAAIARRNSMKCQAIPPQARTRARRS